MLINLTYCSRNTAIFLADSLQIFETVFQYVDEAPNDCAWLLNHLLVDGSVSNLSHMLQKGFLTKVSALVNQETAANLAILCR